MFDVALKDPENEPDIVIVPLPVFKLIPFPADTVVAPPLVT